MAVRMNLFFLANTKTLLNVQSVLTRYGVLDVSKTTLQSESQWKMITCLLNHSKFMVDKWSQTFSL